MFNNNPVSKKELEKSEGKVSSVDIKKNQFEGRVFEAGLDNLFNTKEKCAFYFECDCCSDTLIFVNSNDYYLISYCMSDINLTKGKFFVSDSLVKIVSDGTLVSKTHNWELEVNPKAEPKYFIKDTIHNKYEFEFKIERCDGDMLVSETKGGIKPLVGADFWVRSPEFPDEPSRLTLLAKDNIGYKNITLLISKAYQRGHVFHRPVIDREWLVDLKEGLIILSGAKDGDLGKALIKGNPAIVESVVRISSI